MDKTPDAEGSNLREPTEPSPKPKRRVRRTVEIAEGLHDRLKAKAEAEHRDIRVVAERVITTGLEAEEDDK